MVWIGRLNGPLLTFVFLVAMFVVVFGQPDGPMSLWMRCLIFVALTVGFVLSVRWTTRSWKTKLE
jgi:dolichyl-phosphate-mannose--protein O-mannosyl transferase